MKQGVTFEGTVKKGTFSGEGISGDYWIEGDVLYLDLKSKPPLIPESYIITKITGGEINKKDFLNIDPGGEINKKANFKNSLIATIAISIVLILIVNQYLNSLNDSLNRVIYVENTTILCIGDSLTAPTPENESLSKARYSIYLQDELGDAFEVVNEGHPGYTSADLMDASVLHNSLISVNPGLVILLIGSNDVHSFDPSVTKANIDGMVSEILNTGASLIIMTIPPNVGLYELTDQENWIEVNSHIRNLNDDRLSIYDLAATVCTSDNRVLKYSYSWDGVHFNIEGSTFIGKQLASLIRTV